jgi:hypothetical protein
MDATRERSFQGKARSARGHSSQYLAGPLKGQAPASHLWLVNGQGGRRCEESGRVDDGLRNESGTKGGTFQREELKEKKRLLII